ncbi:MAG: hypothetical protein ACRD1H_12175 [Vicinamibacterales bacterium]
MHARVNVIGFRPDALPVAAELFRTKSAPMIMGWPGFQSTIAMVQWRTGKAVTCSIWETAQQRDESGLRLEYIENLSSYGEMISGSVNRESYVVDLSTVAPSVPPEQRLPAWARVTTGQIPPPHWDAALEMLRPMVASDEATGPDYHGSLFLTNRTLSKAIVIGLWASRRAITDTDDDVHARAYLVRRSGYLAESPTHELFEIVGWY